MKPREVELDVCPECGTIGKHLSGMYRGYCVGPKGTQHKRTRMRPVRFREIKVKSDA